RSRTARASSGPPEQAGEEARTRGAAGVSGERGEETPDHEPGGAVAQPPADGGDFAADLRLVVVGDPGAAALGRLQRDPALPARIAERAGDEAGQGHSTRRVEVGEPDLGLVAAGDRSDAERHVGAEMR